MGKMKELQMEMQEQEEEKNVNDDSQRLQQDEQPDYKTTTEAIEGIFGTIHKHIK